MSLFDRAPQGVGADARVHLDYGGAAARPEADDFPCFLGRIDDEVAQPCGFATVQKGACRERRSRGPADKTIVIVHLATPNATLRVACERSLKHGSMYM
jgi:hypothetical protein